MQAIYYLLLGMKDEQYPGSQAIDGMGFGKGNREAKQ
jgi:hypothetical protein